MYFVERGDSSYYIREYEYKGKYKIDASENNKIKLFGEHPFESNDIKVCEKMKKKQRLITGFAFKLNPKFSWSNKKKLWAEYEE